MPFVLPVAWRSVALLAALGPLRPAAGAGSCEGLTALAIPRVEIVSAIAVPAGPFSPVGSLSPASPGGPATRRPFPAFCRVTGVARPVPGSEIRLEVWLPPADVWNRKFAGTGNSGYSGALGYAGMEAALREGYATAGSDTGHQGGDLKFGAGHPEKIEDWGYRAVHVMTETAKLVVQHYYGRAAARSYFTGCSTGGHQALMEAQRFPADYDGIAAGAPGNNRVRLNVGFLWSWLMLNGSAAEPLSPSRLPLIQQAAVAACDGLDGVKDGLIGDPRRCAFDPGVLLCKGADEGGCLTAAQVTAVRRVYDGARNPRTGEQLFAGWARGSEAGGGPGAAGWSGYFVGQPEPARLDFWRYWVFNDPAWDFRAFDFDRDARYADSKLAFLVANDPDLSAFKAHNGRLLMYHGWADPVVPAEDSIRYYESVERIMGGHGETADFFRLFLAPGMGHCFGGSGPNSLDVLGTLDRWVDQGLAPDRIVASHLDGAIVDRTRPLCPYPQAAHWDGKGSINTSGAFVCVAEGRK
jgi:feruloyl esterase